MWYQVKNDFVCRHYIIKREVAVLNNSGKKLNKKQKLYVGHYGVNLVTIRAILVLFFFLMQEEKNFIQEKNCQIIICWHCQTHRNIVPPLLLELFLLVLIQTILEGGPGPLRLLVHASHVAPPVGGLQNISIAVNNRHNVYKSYEWEIVRYPS